MLHSAQAASATFSPTAVLTLKAGLHDDILTSKGTFSIAADSDGIDPLTEDTTIVIGSVSRTIRAGQFKLDSAGAFRFTGAVDGASLTVRITPSSDGYSFTATVKGTDSAPVGSPLALGLRIGNDGGTEYRASVKVTAAK